MKKRIRYTVKHIICFGDGYGERGLYKDYTYEICIPYFKKKEDLIKYLKENIFDKKISDLSKVEFIKFILLKESSILYKNKRFFRHESREIVLENQDIENKYFDYEKVKKIEFYY